VIVICDSNYVEVLFCTEKIELPLTCSIEDDNSVANKSFIIEADIPAAIFVKGQQSIKWFVCYDHTGH
jgi:hypothetical protein